MSEPIEINVRAVEAYWPHEAWRADKIRLMGITKLGGIAAEIKLEIPIQSNRYMLLNGRFLMTLTPIPDEIDFQI